MGKKQIVLALLRSDLSHFVRQVFHTLHPTELYVPGWYIDAITARLTELMSSSGRRLIINLPPRHLKSIIASVAYSAWMLGHQPEMKQLCVSYSPELAIGFSKHTRTVMQSGWYRDAFPKTVLSSTDNTQELITTTVQGSRRAVAMGGAITGFGADLIIVDDPQKADDVQHETRRTQAIETIMKTVATRLNDPTKGAIVLIQQRLHEEDVSAVLLEKGSWSHLALPAIAEQREEIDIGRGRIHVRESGEVLHPGRLPQIELDKIRKEIGSSTFESQYQQQPGVAGGHLVDLAWFRIYDGQPPRTPDGFVLQSWDPALTTESQSSFSVCTTWRYENHCVYLVDVLRIKQDFTNLLGIARTHGKKANIVVIEASGIGASLYSYLAPEDSRRYYFTKPKDSKEQRLISVSPLIEQGRVWIPREAPWLLDFLAEFRSFPNGKHDDQVDSVTQALHFVRRRLPQPPLGWTPPPPLAASS